MHVVTLCGSPQPRSSNEALLGTASAIAGEGTIVSSAPSPSSIPHFVPGDEGGGQVAALRSAIDTADAVLIASPEYAHSMPGSLKNALDWLVGSGELYGKPVAILCATPRFDGGERGREALAQTLRAQGAVVRHSASILVRHGGDPDAEAVAGVRAALDALAT
jgi:chromate reductase